MKKTVLLLLMLTLVATGLGPTTAQAAYTPPSGGVFNVPDPFGSRAQNLGIIGKIESAIANVRPVAGQPRPQIIISTYFLDRTASSNALIAACQRGVSVRVVLDGDVDDAPAKALIKVLNADNVPDADRNGVPDGPAKAGACNTKLPPAPTPTPTPTAAPAPEPAATGGTGSTLTDSQAERSVALPTDDAFTWGSDGSYVKQCRGSCRGGGGAMHSKFFLFSQTGTASNVVMVSSSNLNAGGATRGWNDMISLTERPNLYNAFRQVHREMTDDIWNTGGRTEFTDGNVVARFFPMRNATKATDPTLDDLNKIKCTSAFGATQIKVSMFYWAHTRGLYLADKLIALGRAGCKVSVIYGAPGKDVRAKLVAADKARRITLYDSRRGALPDGDYTVRTHGKFFTVKGTFNGNRAAYLTVSGSQNWAGSSLAAGDEVTLNVSNKRIHDQYVANWGRIRAKSYAVPKR